MREVRYARVPVRPSSPQYLLTAHSYRAPPGVTSCGRCVCVSVWASGCVRVLVCKSGSVCARNSYTCTYCICTLSIPSPNTDILSLSPHPPSPRLPSSQVLFPLLDGVTQATWSASTSSFQTAIMIHHSRDTAQKQWAETQVCVGAWWCGGELSVMHSREVLEILTFSSLVQWSCRTDCVNLLSNS